MFQTKVTGHNEIITVLYTAKTKFLFIKPF